MGNRSAPTGNRIISGLALLAVFGLSACDNQVTEPAAAPVAKIHGPSFTISPGLVAYTDQTAFEAAVVAAGSTAQMFDYTGLTLGRVTALDTDYGAFHITVDRVSVQDPFGNPGIDIMPDANCSIGTGDCNRIIFNMLDPSLPNLIDYPMVNSLVFPQNVVGFGGYFAQTGWAVGCGVGCPVATGPVTLHFGSLNVTLNDYVPTGFGFIGIVVTAPTTNTLSLTFARTGTWANETVELYNPEYALASATPPGPGTADEQIAALRAFLDGIDFLKGKPNGYDAKLRDVEKALDQDKKNSTKKACKALDQFMTRVNKKTDREISEEDAATLLGMAETLAETIGCSGGPV